MKLTQLSQIIATTFALACVAPNGASGQFSLAAKPSAATQSSATSCSPAPCVLAPTQASEGGNEVTDSLIAADPLNAERLVLGSLDFNCSATAFHGSLDGGSTWTYFCMPQIIEHDMTFSSGGTPLVGYDLNGNAYVAGAYRSGGYGLIAFQKSSDGINWSQPAIALPPGGFNTVETEAMAVDRSPRSPWANSIYISAVQIQSQIFSQVLGASSHDGAIHGA